MPKKSLPIVWYLEEEDLPDDSKRANKIQRVAEATIAWEKLGSESLSVLKARIEDILNE